jgi:excisionase family DNA binding protein
VTTDRLTLRPDEAAVCLGVSRSAFYADVLPQLRTLRVGRTRLVPVAELEAWVEREAARLSAVDGR